MYSYISRKSNSESVVKTIKLYGVSKQMLFEYESNLI